LPKKFLIVSICCIIITSAFFLQSDADQTITTKPNIAESLTLNSPENLPASEIHELIADGENIGKTLQTNEGPNGKAISLTSTDNYFFTISQKDLFSLKDNSHNNIAISDITGFNGFYLWLDTRKLMTASITLSMGYINKSSDSTLVKTSDISLPSYFVGYVYIPFNQFTPYTDAEFSLDCVNWFSMSLNHRPMQAVTILLADVGLYRTGDIDISSLQRAIAECASKRASLISAEYNRQSFSLCNAELDSLFSSASSMIKSPQSQREINLLSCALHTAFNLLEPANYTSLLVELISECSQLTPGNYTTQSYLNMTMYLAAAKQAGLSEINQAYEALLDARSALVPIPLYTLSLKKAVNECKSFDKSLYSVQSADLLNDAINNAERILANPASSQADIDGAETALHMALRNLIPIVDAATASLVKALAIASSVDKYKYTVESYYKLSLAMNKGTDMLQQNLNKMEMDAQAELIMDAFDRLVPAKLDLRQLMQAITKAESLNKEVYYANEWNKMRTALNKAYDIIEDDEAIQSEIDTVWQELLNAIAALRKKPVKAVQNNMSHIDPAPDDGKPTYQAYNPTEETPNKPTVVQRIIFPGTSKYLIAAMFAICMFLAVLCFISIYRTCVLRLDQKNNT